jgi:sulfoquinovosyltransferase
MMRGADLSAAYATADMFVMPSETETLGFVVLEAMASGLPVVSVAAGGLTDIVTRPGEVGFLYQPGDYQAAAEQVGRAGGAHGGLRRRRCRASGCRLPVRRPLQCRV